MEQIDLERLRTATEALRDHAESLASGAMIEGGRDPVADAMVVVAEAVLALCEAKGAA